MLELQNTESGAEWIGGGFQCLSLLVFLFRKIHTNSQGLLLLWSVLLSF